MLRQIGLAVLILIKVLGDVTTLTARVGKAFFSGRFRWKNVLVQMVRVGFDSLPITLVSVGFVGMVFSVQIATEFIQYGAGRMVGAVLAIALTRELAPLITAIVISGRIGSSFAAEIGTMKVTEQVDALYVLNSNPVNFLVLPRYLACIVMLPFLTLLADVVGFLGGFIVAVYVTGIDAHGFLSSAQNFLKMSDITGGLIKAMIFGLILAAVGCYYGLVTEGGARGVGESTTRAVVVAMLTIFIVNYFFSMFLF